MHSEHSQTGKYYSVICYFFMKRGSVISLKMLSERDGLRLVSSHPDFHKGLSRKITKDAHYSVGV